MYFMLQKARLNEKHGQMIFQKMLCWQKWAAEELIFIVFRFQ